MNKVGIIGGALSELKENMEEYSRNELLYTTVKAALESTGLEIGEIDQVISASCDTIDGVSISNAFAVDDMGAFMKEESKVEEDGLYALSYSFYRMLTGHWKTCMLVAHGKNSDVGPSFYANMMCDPFFLRPMGLDIYSAAALQARRYMEKNNITEEEVAQVAVKNLQAGSLNEHTLRQQEVSLKQVMSSPYISTPIKELEAPPVTDGAAVLILATEDLAGVKDRPTAWISGVGFSQENYYPGYRDLASSSSCKAAAQMAYREAAIDDPNKELDFAEISENFAFYEPLLYENLGLCSPGEGMNIFKEGITQRNGNFPVNPSGGGLCANPIMVTGLIRAWEAYLQLTGQAGRHQLPKEVKKGLVHTSSGMFLQSNMTVVLTADRD